MQLLTPIGGYGGIVTPETMAITNSTDSRDSGGSVTPVLWQLLIAQIAGIAEVV